MRLPAGPALLSLALVSYSLPVAANFSEDGEDLTPVDAVGYQKGRPKKIQVVTIAWTQVEVRTARAFLKMRDAAARDGVELWIYSGFRTHERQRQLYEAWRAGYGNRAARPGYSNHQSGHALDIYLGMPGATEWLQGNARRFGFQDTVSGEPWHYEYVKKPARKGRRR